MNEWNAGKGARASGPGPRWSTWAFAVLAFTVFIEARASATTFSSTLHVVRSNDNTVVVSWPATFSNSVLIATSDLSPPVVWTDVTNPVEIAGNMVTVRLPAQDDGPRYFRLKQPPIPIFQFAVFYNSLLEFTWGPPLIMRGPVHANGPIFLGSVWSLRFDDTVTTARFLLKTNWYGHATSEYTGSISYLGSPTYVTNSPLLLVPIGTNNSPAALREIIHPPPPGEDVDSPLGRERFYNKASIVMLVSNSLVNIKIKNDPADASPLTLTYSITNAYQLRTNLPFLSVTNTFRDQRENNKTVKVTQIDIGQYRRWTLTNTSVFSKFPVGSGAYPNILYVADHRTVAGTELAAVRITNGVAIPTNDNTGFTLATPNPLYILGHYNCPQASHLGTTNTTATQPSSLISDALTILSPNWRDSQSQLALGDSGKSPATSTTVNAATLTGVVYSTGSGSSQFSGGVANLPRLLEDWSSVTLTLNTSIVNFFNSAQATNRWKDPGVYYNAPSRNFNFDQNFRSYPKLPPGTPFVGMQ